MLGSGVDKGADVLAFDDLLDWRIGNDRRTNRICNGIVTMVTVRCNRGCISGDRILAYIVAVAVTLLIFLREMIEGGRPASIGGR